MAVGNLVIALNPEYKEFIQLVTFSINYESMRHQELKNIPWIIGACFASISSLFLSILALYTSRLCVNQIIDLNFKFNPFRNRIISISLIAIMITIFWVYVICDNVYITYTLTFILIVSGYVAEMVYPYLVYLRYQTNNTIKTLFGTWYFFWISPVWFYIVFLVLNVIDSLKNQA